MSEIKTNIYDVEEIHENCKVVIWRNSQTGEESVGWYEREDSDRYESMERTVLKLSDALVKTGSDLRDCRNELCLRCGSYKEAHKGACDGCRWKDGDW